MAIFGAQDASRASFFDGISDVFLHVLEFLPKKMQHQESSTVTKKQICC